MPITATRLPARSTPSAGHWLVCTTAPWKSSWPGKSFFLNTENAPAALMKNRAVVTEPSSLATSQRCASSSQTAEVTRVLNR